MIAFEQSFLGDEQVPRVWRIVRGGDSAIDAVVAWLGEHRAQLVAERDTFGAVLLRGFDAIDSPQHFDAVLGTMATRFMDYIGGSAPREAVYGRVTTASGLPGTYSLALHQEMAYQSTRPDALALFCEVPPDEEGETPIADARVVTSKIDAGVRARFEAGGVGVRRTLPSPAEGSANRVPRPWNHVFGTTDRTEVARIADERGWRVEWRPDDSMWLWQQVLPAFKAHPRTGESVWANQVHYHMPECLLRWAVRDGRIEEADRIRREMVDVPETFDRCYHADGSPVAGEDAEHVWDVLAASEIPIRWERGDVLFLDNVLALHGRRRYRGQRRILVGLMRD
jgi:hypothetical protein